MSYMPWHVSAAARQASASYVESQAVAALSQAEYPDTICSQAATLKMRSPRVIGTGTHK